MKETKRIDVLFSPGNTCSSLIQNKFVAEAPMIAVIGHRSFSSTNTSDVILIPSPASFNVNPGSPKVRVSKATTAPAPDKPA